MKILDFLFAFSDRKKIIFVDCEEDFQLFIQEIIIEKEIAIDTEVTWRDTYYPILNLIQVATEKKNLFNRLYKVERFERFISNFFE